MNDTLTVRLQLCYFIQARATFAAQGQRLFVLDYKLISLKGTPTCARTVGQSYRVHSTIDFAWELYKATY